jgi:cytochrome c oxidase subunit 4
MTDTALVQHDPAGHSHPTERLLVQTALILGVITAVEVAWSYLPWPDSLAMEAAEIGGLCIMMGAKFYIVASVFMHLKWEKKLLTFMFYGGLFLAVFVYLAVLATFHFFTTGEPPYVGLS